jgi:hypothetical protein
VPEVGEEDLDLNDLGRATIRFGHQVDRQGRRVELKTGESKSVLPLPRSAAVMLLEHKARWPNAGRPRDLSRPLQRQAPWVAAGAARGAAWKQ